MVLGCYLAVSPLTVNLLTANNLNNCQMIKEKKCSICGQVKPLSEFNKDKHNKDGLKSECAKCHNMQNLQYYHTKDGLITRIYSNQKRNCKHRGYDMPSYSKEELKDWLFSQKLFHELFDAWRLSGFDRMLAPSVDRKNDYISYNLSNIQLMTWAENNEKAISDRLNGINNKASKIVLQYDLKGNFIKKYYSIAQAGRETGANHTHISSCCKGKRNTAGGFKWKYDDNTNE
jgi:hypothetical protein